MKVFFSVKAISDIQNFIKASEEAFIELFSNSGIWAEDMIVQSYLAHTTEFKKDLFNSINLKLNKVKILGRKNLGIWQELVFHLGDRLIVVYFSEDRKKKIRIIESVGIDRKPLIF